MLTCCRRTRRPHSHADMHICCPVHSQGHLEDMLPHMYSLGQSEDMLHLTSRQGHWEDDLRYPGSHDHSEDMLLRPKCNHRESANILHPKSCSLQGHRKEMLRPKSSSSQFHSKDMLRPMSCPHGQIAHILRRPLCNQGLSSYTLSPMFSQEQPSRMGT